MIEFRILGPLEVQDEGRLAPLGGTRQRAVLAILLLHRGEVVSVDRLVDELWGESPPDTATKTVQVYVSRLRKELGQDALRTRGGGYVLEVDADRVDAARFERLITEGRDALERGEATTASGLLRDALALWRGPPLGDLAYEEFAQSEVARLEELRLVALEQRIEADLALGGHAALIPELETLVREHPARERLRAQLILSLYRSGRQADALAGYRDTRRALVEELGIEPGRELQELERAILAQDPELDAPARSRPARASPRARRGGVLAGLGGGVLLAVAVAAVFAGGGGDSDAKRATANSLAVIDPESDDVVAAIPTGIRPADVASGAGRIWVANEADGTVTEIDPSRRVAVSTTGSPGGVAGLAFGAGGVWIGGERRLIRLDPGFRSIDRSVRLKPPDEFTGYSGPNLVAVRYGSVWVGSDYGEIARVDPDTRNVETVSLGNSPSAIATGAGGVWVTDDVDNTVTRIDPASANSVTATTPVGGGPSAVATGAGAVWVANTQDNTVVRLDPQTAVVTDTIPVGRRPTGVAVGEGSVWVANSLSGTVSRIDPRDREVEATIPTGEAPQSLTVARGVVWVSVQPSATPEPLKPAERGRVLRIMQLQDDGPTDPVLDFDVQRQSALCARLYNYPDRPYPEGARLRPEVAARLPSVSNDGLTYEFRLRRGFRFSPPSNEPVTAEAFERAIERALSPRLGGSSPGGFLAAIVGGDDYTAGRARQIAGISARGTTLVIRLERPVPDLPARLATPFYCAVPPNTPITPRGVDAVPSAGPYYVASHVPQRSLVLRRNPNYDGPRPHSLAEIRYTMGVREEKAVAAVEAGRADYVKLNPASFTQGVPAQLRERLVRRYGPRSEAARAGRQQLFAQPSLSTYSFFFNTSRGPFTDPRLRRAVNFAMDRRSLAEHTGGGELGQPTDQFIPPGLPGFEDAAIYPLGGPDLESGRRLAGGKRRQAVLYTCKLPGCTRHAQILRSNLRAIGIDLEVRQFNIPEMFKRLEDPSEPFDIGYSNWFVDYADPFGYINEQYSREGFRPGMFDDAEFERRMAHAAALSGDARLRAYAKLDRDLAAIGAPAATFATGVSTYFLSARMGCQVLHPLYGLDLAALCVRGR